MKKLTFWKSLFLLFALIVGTSTSWADDETINFSTLGLENSVQYTDPFGTNISVTFGGGGNDGKYYTTGTGIRTYGNGTITITAKGKTVTKIETTFSESSYAPAATTVWSSNGTNSKTSAGTSATWEGSATEVVMTRPSGSGHWRLQVIKVTYTPADPREAVNVNSLTFNPTSIVVGGATSQATAGNDKTACTTATYAYESLDKDIATCTAAGVITAVAKGTARIKATMSIPNDDPDYRVGTATITEEITVSNPSHNAIFMSNGAEYNRVSVEEGEDITFPASNPSDLGGKVFMGWAEDPIDGTTQTAPTYVTSATMGNSDVTYYAVFATAEGTGEDGWIATPLASLTATDVFVIVGKKASGYFAMSNDKGTGAAPDAVEVTVDGDKITSTVAAKIKWNISGDATDGYTFYPNGSTTTWLYCTNTNNGVRVGTNANKTFTISEDGYLCHGGTSRYVGIYNSQDWRCYASYSTGSNIADQTFAFYKKTEGTTYSAYCTTVTVTLAPAKTYTTLTSAYALDFTTVSDDLKAYIAKNGVSAGSVKMTQVNKVPAGTGLVLKATNPGTAVNVPVFDGTGADDVEGNMMEGSATATTAVAENDGYILKEGVFHPATAGTLAAGKAYLHIAVPANARPLEMSFDDATTAINGIEEVAPVNVKTRKVVKNGRLIIETANGEFTIDGARMK